MFILKATPTTAFSKDDIGTIEEVARDSRLVDQGIKELEKFSRNAPSFDPERRRFLKHAAVLAGLIAGGQFLQGCSTIEPVQYQGKSYGSWEAWLMSQDLIRGPDLIINPRTGMVSDFGDHLNEPSNYGFGAVDYNVPIGTPIVPVANGFSVNLTSDRIGGNILVLLHGLGFNSQYAHLDRYSDLVYKGKPNTYRNTPFLDQDINKSKIIAFSGATGIFFTRYYMPHLHLSIRWHDRANYTATGDIYREGRDPFTLGIDQEKPLDEYVGSTGRRRAARPVYWDTKTSIQLTEKNKKIYLQRSLDTLEKRLRQSDLDQTTIKEILDRQNKPEELRDYLGMRVLQKKKDKEGKERYEFMPGSLMYKLMLEIYSGTAKERFIAMLPFIFPSLKEIYQKANPGVQF